MIDKKKVVMDNVSIK